MCQNIIQTEPIAQGTTPTFTFVLPDTLYFSSIAELCVAFRQRNNTAVEKSLSDTVPIDNNSFSVTLTQTDTLSLRANDFVDFQVRMVDVAGNAMASEIYRAKVLKSLCGEVLA